MIFNRDILFHYLSWYGILGMFAVAAAAVSLSLWMIRAAARVFSRRVRRERRADYLTDETNSLAERFYELTFSNTAILLFVSIYFMIDYFGAGARFRGIWDTYNGIILLVLILASVLLTSFLDNLLIPLDNVRPGERASMRLMGMLYMLIVFAYIKFIYEDNNYDTIIIYFLTLVIGRFVYFDASLESFGSAMSESLRNLPLLFLTLLCTAAIGLFGWGTGYLYRENGVVFNLFLAHLYLLAVIFIIHRVHRLKGRKRRAAKEQSELDVIDLEQSVEEDKDNEW